MGAEGAVRPVPVPAIRPAAKLGGAAAALVLLLLLGLLIGAPAILLIGCVVAGYGITYLSGIPLNVEERLAFGTVLGAMAGAAASFVASMLARDVTVLTVTLGLATALAVGAYGALTERDRLASDLVGAVA